MGNTFNTNLRGWMGYHIRNNNFLFFERETNVFVYAQEGAWAPLIEDSFARPYDVQFIDRCRNTALHIACRRQPPIDAILALIRAYPAATSLRTVDGMTPLHFACYCGASIDVIRLLISSCAESVSKLDRRGRSPLHCACAGFRTKDKHEILKLLLDVHPDMVLVEDNMGRTPLSLMLDDYVEEIEEITCANGNYSFSDHNSNISHSHRSLNMNQNRKTLSKELEDCLKCTSILLRAAYYGSATDIILTREPFRLLHASVGVPCCPPHFIRLAIKLKPDQIRERDINGNLPLHIAALTPLPSVASGKDMRVNTIESILALYPMAARISNRDGFLPLALAFKSRKMWNDGIRTILEAHPAALTTVQIDVKCYHFILERIARTLSPSVLFEVIRATPEILPVTQAGVKFEQFPSESQSEDWDQ